MTPEIYGQQGMALAQQNRLAEALTFLDRAVQMKPDFGEAHHNRGVILQHLGRTQEALASYDKALKTRPNDPGTHYNRGNALLQLRHIEDAAASFEQSLKLAPNNIEALMNRGYALMQLERPAEALPNYEKVLKLKPGYAEAHGNRGRALARLNRLDEALASYDTALQLKPGEAAIHNDRGQVLMSLGRPGEAVASFERALQFDSDYAQAWFNRGLAQVELRQVEDAIASFGRAALLRPGNLAALSQKSYHQARICDWTDRGRDAELLHRGARADGVEPFLALAFDDDPASQWERSCKWAAQYRATPAHAVKAARPEKLRLGYFSADFRNHAMMHLMAGLFERHDRNRFEVHLFAFGAATQDEMRRRAMAAADRFHEVGTLSDGDIVALARAEGIDIAIDLMGYTRGCRTEIFAARAAPIQVSHLGYPGTMGAPFIDYLMADKWVAPEADRRFYTETVIHLPHSYFPTDDRRVIAERAFTRAELGLPGQGFVFCCFNNNYKISPAEFDIWMRLLGQVEGSVLWLLKDNDLAAANLARAAQARGVDPGRLVFAGRMPHAEHLARHRCADLFLDTFNYNAHTTAVDALWTGVPLVTRPGRGFPARVAASLLHAIEMPDLVCDTADAYEQLALALATDPARLAAVKARLAANRLTTPLFDTAQFTRDVEHAYDAMVARHRAGPRLEAVT